MITLLIAIVGILILFLLSRAFGLERNVTFANNDVALQALQHRHPDFTPESSLLSEDLLCAVFENSSHDALGLVFALGDDAVTRILEKGALHSIGPIPANQQTNGLMLHLTDLTCPQIKIQMTDQMRDDWLPRLQRYLGDQS